MGFMLSGEGDIFVSLFGPSRSCVAFDPHGGQEEIDSNPITPLTIIQTTENQPPTKESKFLIYVFQIRSASFSRKGGNSVVEIPPGIYLTHTDTKPFHPPHFLPALKITAR